jgi:hypothetical protein
MAGGQSIAMPAAIPSLSQAYEAQKKRNATIAAIVACAAILGAIAVGLTKGTKALGFGSEQTDGNVLTAQGTTPDGSILAAAGAQAPPMLNKDAEAPAKMPQDVYEWLEHLRKTEEKRVDMTSGQGASAMIEKTKLSVDGGIDAIKDALNGIDDPNAQLRSPTEGLATLLKQMQNDTLHLVEFFNSVTPPAECVPIRDAYDRALRETAGQIGDVADSMAAADIQGLLKMKGASNEGIDTYGKKTDRLVGEICDKYHTSKWFSIAGDITFGGIFSKFQ